jgi:cytochrome P450
MLCFRLIALLNTLRSGMGKGVFLSQYNDRFKKFRKAMHKVLNVDVICRDFQPIVMAEVQSSLRRLLAKPKDFDAHFRRMTAAIVMKVTYGYDLQEDRDPFIKIAEEAVQAFSIAARGGVWLVDALPIRMSFSNVISHFCTHLPKILVQFVPRWFPGAGFQNVVARLKPFVVRMAETPYAWTKKTLVSQTQ